MMWTVRVGQVASAACADGATVTLDLAPSVPHVWQAYHARLPEAAAALARAAAFLAHHLKTA